MNPYASEEASRLRLTPKPKKDESEGIDHPLIEGKKMDITRQEMRNFTKAMGDDKFKSMMSEYVDEISDPKHRPELDQYLRELEQRGEMPPGTKLIQPNAGFCIKTTARKMVSDIKKTFFDQKTFVNVCFHDEVDKPVREMRTNPDGKSGTSWQLPYRVSKGKPDQDSKKTFCMTYDVVFHSEVASYLIYPEFKKFVADTAIDGVNRVLAENKEKISNDYKIMKHVICKGEKPQLMTIKSKGANELIDNMDLSKVETKLQKDIMKQRKETQAKEAAQNELQKNVE